jgi:hypothetical protein
MEYLIEQLKIENQEILKRRLDLEIYGDFTEDGEKLSRNDLKIKHLNKLSVSLYVGSCSCGNRIPRQEYEIKFCAYCHKEIL